MKKLVTCMIIGAALVLCTACSAGGASPQGSSPSSFDGSLSVVTPMQGEGFQEYDGLAWEAYLRDYETGMWVAYGAPEIAGGSMGAAQTARMEKGELEFVYNFANLGDGANSLEGLDLLEEIEGDILKSDLRSYHADSMRVDAMSASSVNGWDTEYFSGLLINASGSSAVPFAMCVSHHGEDVTWCIVVDDTADQSTPVSTLEEWADKVAHTYRDHEG